MLNCCYKQNRARQCKWHTQKCKASLLSQLSKGTMTIYFWPYPSFMVWQRLYQMDQKAASCLQSERDICSEALEKMGNDARTYLPMNLLWISVCQELKQCFSNFATSAHATVSHNTIMQKPNESLCTYVPHYNTLYCAVTDKNWSQKYGSHKELSFGHQHE